MNKISVVILALAMLNVFIFAQARGGDIYGTVVLSDGSKIPGVLITVTCDKIGTKTTISSEKGNFRSLNLPPGVYTIKFELEGFKTVIREGIVLSLGKSITLNILMETTTLKEEVIVSGRVGVIDTRKTIVGVNLSKEMIESIPTGRDPWTLISSVPGILVDVGGTESGQPSAFLAAGGDQEDVTWNIDGANITDPSAIGTAPAYLNVNSYAELQISLGANDIAAQTGGVQLNFVTKRAGNIPSGDFHLYVEDMAWAMKQDPTQYMVDEGLVVPGVDRLYQYGINFGSAIIKDKLWWFGSWVVQDIHKRTAANLEDATWLVSGYGKLNFQLGNTSGDFHINFDSKRKWGRTFLSPSQQDENSLRDQDSPRYLLYGSLSQVFGELMMNVKTVYTDAVFNLDSRGADFNPATGHYEGNEFKIVDGWTGAEGSAWAHHSNQNTLNFALDGNYFLEGALGGDHEIKFGVDYYTADTSSQTLTPNQRISYVYREEPSRNYLRIQPDYSLNVHFRRVSAYIQDTVTFGKLTIALGLRYDKETGRVNPFKQPGFTWYEPGSPHHGERLFNEKIFPLNADSLKALTSWNLISPRLSFTYDITGDGKNVVKVSAGRYMPQSGNTIAGNYIPYRYGYASWTDSNLDEIPQYNEIGDLWYDAPLVQVEPSSGLNRISYSDNYNAPYLDELTFTFEKALTDEAGISITGFYKRKHNLTNTVNSRGESVPVTRGIMADGSFETKSNWENTGNITVGGTTVTLWQQIETPIGTQYYNLEKAYLKYLGIQFRLQKKLSNKWMADLSFTYDDWKRHWDESETLDMNNFDFFDGGYVAPATQGSGLRDIWVNSRWMVKFTGMYQLPWGLNLSAFFQAREGGPQPLRRRIAVKQGHVFLYRDGYKVGSERLPTFWKLNVSLEKTLRIDDKTSATMVVDWYNVTNNQLPLKYNLNIGAETPSNTNPFMWSNPGLFQIGIRINF